MTKVKCGWVGCVKNTEGTCGAGAINLRAEEIHRKEDGDAWDEEHLICSQFKHR